VNRQAKDPKRAVTTVRLDLDVRDALAAYMEREERSMNSAINRIIRASLIGSTDTTK